MSDKETLEVSLNADAKGYGINIVSAEDGHGPLWIRELTRESPNRGLLMSGDEIVSIDGEDVRRDYQRCAALLQKGKLEGRPVECIAHRRTNFGTEFLELLSAEAPTLARRRESLADAAGLRSSSPLLQRAESAAHVVQAPSPLVQRAESAAAVVQRAAAAVPGVAQIAAAIMPAAAESASAHSVAPFAPSPAGAGMGARGVRELAKVREPPRATSPRELRQPLHADSLKAALERDAVWRTAVSDNEAFMRDVRSRLGIAS